MYAEANDNIDQEEAKRSWSWFAKYLLEKCAMGNSINQAQPEVREEQRGVKRELEETDDSEGERERIEEENLNTPKRKKVKTTSRYIYETLFINGENSDVTIRSLGREWRLHRIYLCQSNYFSSMFSGSWRESSQNIIDMDIPDQNVDIEALQLAFGSLYKDDVLIKPSIVNNVLAAATLLGLDGLIAQCVDVMAETMSGKTACSYHQAAGMYGQQEVQRKCLDWLEKNLMTSQSVELLKDLSTDLMEELIVSPTLFVMQVEMDAYSMLKKWMYTQLNPAWEGNMKELVVQTDAFYKAYARENRNEFLELREGSRFACVFRGLRLQHIINDLASTRILEEDAIIPKTWLLPMYRRQWLQMLRVEQGQDKGPESSKCLDNFADTSLRCGRVLYKDGEYCWRWTGYNFGVDLLVSFTSRLIIFKRNTHSQSCPGGVSLQQKRHLIFQMTVTSFDSLGHTRFCKSTGIKRLNLAKDEEAVIMGVDRHVPFPLHISCNFLLYTPKHASSSSRQRAKASAAAASASAANHDASSSSSLSLSDSDNNSPPHGNVPHGNDRGDGGHHANLDASVDNNSSDGEPA